MTEKPWYREIRWGKLVVLLLAFVLMSLALVYLLQHRPRLPLRMNEWVALAAVFGFALVVNLSLVPVPFALPVMVVAAGRWNPWLVALAGSMGACLGEFSGYYLGYLGKKVAIPEDMPGYRMIQNWTKRYGMWAIAVLSFQPVIPVEIGGFVAGVTRMPVGKFLLALWIGKYPKYVLLIYAGLGLIRFLPAF